jgi:hypothetical protein
MRSGFPLWNCRCSLPVLCSRHTWIHGTIGSPACGSDVTFVVAMSMAPISRLPHARSGPPSRISFRPFGAFRPRQSIRGTTKQSRRSQGKAENYSSRLVQHRQQHGAAFVRQSVACGMNVLDQAPNL